jgi:hypothetical protein
MALYYDLARLDFQLLVTEDLLVKTHAAMKVYLYVSLTLAWDG